MNDKQLEAARSQLKNEIAAIGYGWIDGKYRNPPKKYRLREKELDCIDMINSLLCYGYGGCSDAAAILHNELKWDLPREDYNPLANEYINRFGKIYVLLYD